MSKMLLRLRLMYPHPVTKSILEQHGCQIEEQTLVVVFPQGTRRERVTSSLSHVQRYRLILPDQSVFEELFHLTFQQSMLSLPFAVRKGGR
jgi:hypothetical protein